MRILPCVLLMLVPGSALSQAAPAQPTPDTVKLGFAWPANVRARVDARRYRERHTDRKHDTTDASMSYRMTGARSGDEYLIRFDDFQVPGTEAIPNSTAIAERLSAFVPSYRVRASGEFARLESTATSRAFLDSMMTVWTSKDGPPSPHVKQLIATMTSDAVLEARAAEEWNALVGTWIDAALEIGAVYGTEGEEPIPIFQNAVVKYEYEFSALRRMPCDSVATPAGRDCIEVQMVSRPDAAAMRQLVQRLVGGIMADSSVGFTEFNLENVVTLVARPQTLLPVHLTITKTVSGSARAEGKTETLHQIEVKTQKYTYDKKD